MDKIPEIFSNFSIFPLKRSDHGNVEKKSVNISSHVNVEKQNSFLKFPAKEGLVIAI